MADNSAIEWTQATWNPVTGCSKISAGCKNCYAERLAKRLRAMGVKRYARGFEVVTHEDVLSAPLRWISPRIIFVNSMSDLFHEDVSEPFLRRVFDVMNRCPQHTFQLLTKRTKRLREVASTVNWTSNIWIGASVEDSRVLDRVPDLLCVRASVRFLSIEPLIGPIDRVPLQGIQWVIVGGESGPGARPMEKGWVESILRQCRAHHVPFFFKQWGGTRKGRTGRILHGRTYDEMPLSAAGPAQNGSLTQISL